jgi:hypothetical protein
MNHHNHRESSYLPAYKAAVIYVPIRHTSTTVENSLQIDLFMQNKPNLLDAQMNVNPYITTDYEKFIPLAGQKTNPIQTQTKPIQTQLPKW